MGVSVVAFSAATYAMEEPDVRYVQGSPRVQEQEKLSAETIVDFTHYSYTAAKEKWSDKDFALAVKLMSAGWTMESFNGTTGTAAKQAKSVAGALAFKDNDIVIALRGTQMLNASDWKTNGRLYRNPVSRFFGTLLGNKSEAEKANMVTAQNLYDVGGEVAAGFLQSHLSYWSHIEEAILTHAQKTGKSAKDFNYTIVGHSQGGAKAQLAAGALLSSIKLGIGVNYLENSFILSGSDVEGPDELRDFHVLQSDFGDFHVVQNEIGDFHGIAKKEVKKNENKVEAVVFESPRVFGDVAAKQVEDKIGKDNLLRVENRGLLGADPVPHLAPQAAGFKHVGTVAKVNKGTLLGRHMMGNVGPAVLENKLIEKHRANAPSESTKGGFFSGVKSVFKKVGAFFGG